MTSSYTLKALPNEEPEHPMPSQALIHVERFQGSGDSVAGYSGESREVVASLDAANAVTSRTNASLLSSEAVHKPVLDIDLPVQAIPSSTPGHFHLYIDKELSWPQYERLLNVLAEVGIIEYGFAESAIRRGYSAVRLPWVTKED